MFFITEQIELLNKALSLRLPDSLDIRAGSYSRGEPNDRNKIYDDNGEPVQFYVDDIDDDFKDGRTFYIKDGEEIEVETCYAKNPDFNWNDYVLLELEYGVEYPIDELIAPLVKFLFYNRIRTLGSDQGVPKLDIDGRPHPLYDKENIINNLGYINVHEDDMDKLQTLFDEKCDPNYNVYTIAVEDGKRMLAVDKRY